jgi:hypothetical protein
VIPARTGDDLLLLRAPEQVVVHPHELDLRVVGVGPAVAVEHLRHAGGGERDDPLGKQRGSVGRHRRERVVVGQPERLRAQRLGDLRVAVADVHAPQPGHRVEVRAALVVGQRAALAADDHAPRAARLVLAQDAEGVEDMTAIDVAELE